MLTFGKKTLTSESPRISNTFEEHVYFHVHGRRDRARLHRIRKVDTAGAAILEALVLYGLWVRAESVWFQSIGRCSRQFREW